MFFYSPAFTMGAGCLNLTQFLVLGNNFGFNSFMVFFGGRGTSISVQVLHSGITLDRVGHPCETLGIELGCT